MAVNKILAQKDGKQKYFTPAVWNLLPEGKHGWVAVSVPPHEVKSKIPTPPEAIVTKVSLGEKDSEIGAKGTASPLPPKTDSKNKGGRPPKK